MCACALAGVTRLVEHHPMHQEVTGPISWSWHMPRFRAQSPVEGMQEAADQCIYLIKVSISLSEIKKHKNKFIFF